jgi:hypothetical protein
MVVIKENHLAAMKDDETVVLMVDQLGEEMVETMVVTTVCNLVF